MVCRTASITAGEHPCEAGQYYWYLLVFKWEEWLLAILPLSFNLLTDYVLELGTQTVDLFNLVRYALEKSRLRLDPFAD
jgi:hypothetical protein